MLVSNQKLSRFEPHYTDDVTKPFDYDMMKNCILEIIKPIWNPLQAQYPVEITDDNQTTTYSEDEIVEQVLQIMSDSTNQKMEKEINGLWKQTLGSFRDGLTASEVFIAQAYGSPSINPKTLPVPSPTVIYVPQDLKDACKKYISNGQQDDSELIVNTAFFMNTPCVMFHFLSKFTFDEFKDYVNQVVAMFANNLTPETASKFADFNKMTLQNIEGVILRSQDGEECDEYSFARILMRAAIDFAKSSNDCGVIAPYLDELICPKNIIFLNLDGISKAPISKLTKDLNDVKDGLKVKYKPVSLSKISKLSSIQANKRKIAQQMRNHQNMMQNANQLAKRGIYKFRKVAMTKSDLSKAITKIVKKESNVSASENYAKTIKSSFLRPNRRKPDDFNVAGKSISMLYKPDIHIYLDTSGSISEDNYKEAILTLITLSKKLNVNLYFNSFSHEISKQTKLQTRGKSINGIYTEFQKVPKVTGGTQYHIVWDYIMRSPKRRKEISLMITDFEYYPPSKRVDYPPKLYYAPIATSSYYWKSMVEAAEDFCKNMYHIDRNIRKHILMN